MSDNSKVILTRHIIFSPQINMLKGWACIGVFLHHFVLAFYSGINDGNFADAKVGGVERIFSSPPFFGLINGSFWVYVFWVVSGYLITSKWKHGCQGQDMFKTLTNKYIKLIPYVFVINVFLFVALLMGYEANQITAGITMSGWLEGQLKEVETIKSFLINTFYNPWFRGVSLYNSALWTMKTELFGSAFLMGVLFLTGNTKHRKFIWSILVVITVLSEFSYIAFLLGAIVAFEEDKLKKFMKSKNIFSLGIIMLGIIFGSYHTTYFVGKQFIDIPDVNNYGFPAHSYGILYCMGAFLLLIAFLALTMKENICLAWLGKHSSYIYIVHIPVLLLIGCPVFNAVYRKVGYFVSTLIVLVICGGIIIFISYGFMKISVYINAFSEKCVKRIVG